MKFNRQLRQWNLHYLKRCWLWQLVPFTFVLLFSSTLPADSLSADKPSLPVTSVNLPTDHSVQPAETSAQIATTAPVSITNELPLSTVDNHYNDLSVVGMYHHADIVVKTVIIGLLCASILTWAIFFAKGLLFCQLRRQLKQESYILGKITQLNQLAVTARSQGKYSVLFPLYQEVDSELQLSDGLDSKGIKVRTQFRLQQWIAATTHRFSYGNSYLATVGAITPFIGLFGTVWGIMNSFIGIARTQTTNLGVVAPGIAEALLATAIGLVAAIPAVVFYNMFARSIRNYRAKASQFAGTILLLQARALDKQKQTDITVYPLTRNRNGEKNSMTQSATIQAG